MLKKSKSASSVGGRAWNILRLALLSARKGGVLRQRLAVDLRLLPKYLKNLRHSSTDRRRRCIGYGGGERELSFDDTPMFHVKMSRPSSLRFSLLPRIPCINPEVIDFDNNNDYGYDFDFNRDNNNDDEDMIYYSNCEEEARKSFSKGGDEEDHVYDDCEVCDETTSFDDDDDDDGIDAKAEEFIAKFYAQMKMQRQISYLQYDEMLD